MGAFSGVLELLIFKVFWPLRPDRDTKLSLNKQRGPFNVKMLPLLLASDDWYKQKKYRDRSNEYVTIRIYDLEVTQNESVSDSFDTALCNNGTQINFTDIINV